MSLDVGVVESWLRDRVDGACRIVEAKKFEGGQSNPTYLLRGPDRAFVLRRKPPGTLLKSAHAVDREFRVQSALLETEVPVARMFAYCDDPSVLGAEFYVMEHVAGRSFDDPRLGEIPRRERSPYVKEMARVLAAVHSVAIDEVGLGDFGPRGNYFRRQIDRWTRQYRATETGTLPAMDRLIARLDEACPEEDGRIALVHGDYRIDNLLFAPDGPRIAAVLDWELSTLGHPLADLGAVLMQWRMPPGDQGRGLAGVDRAAEGLPSDAQFVAWYCDAMGLTRPDNLGVIVAFCFFRMAAILQGVKKRALDGNASDPERGLRLGAYVPRYAEAGLEALDEAA
jgi:aminoglycoside phosphotransferase (APT) family kinase protein